jgi:hypothetical protein
MTRNPKTAGEWQEAVNVAEFLLLIDSARQYGLITGGAEVDANRASAILARGRQLGYRPLRLEELLRRYLRGEGN